MTRFVFRHLDSVEDNQNWKEFFRSIWNFALLYDIFNTAISIEYTTFIRSTVPIPNIINIIIYGKVFLKIVVNIINIIIVIKGYSIAFKNAVM